MNIFSSVIAASFAVILCLAPSLPVFGMGSEPMAGEAPFDAQPYVANGGFEGGLSGRRDSGYGVAMPWEPYVASGKTINPARFEVINGPLAAIYSGQLAQRWYGDGPWRGGVYQSFALPPGVFSFEIWYADPASAGLDLSKKINIRMGIYDGISGYHPPVTVRWNSVTGTVSPQWQRLSFYGIPVTGRAATLYIETWNNAATPHNVVVDNVSIRAESIFGQPEVGEKGEVPPAKGKKRSLPRQ